MQGLEQIGTYLAKSPFQHDVSSWLLLSQISIPVATGGCVPTSEAVCWTSRRFQGFAIPNVAGYISLFGINVMVAIMFDIVASCRQDLRNQRVMSEEKAFCFCVILPDTPARVEKSTTNPTTKLDPKAYGLKCSRS